LLLDLGSVEKERFFGEFTLMFQDGVLVLVRKTETYKPLKPVDTDLIVILK
jgi:hypothetical protein